MCCVPADRARAAGDWPAALREQLWGASGGGGPLPVPRDRVLRLDDQKAADELLHLVGLEDDADPRLADALDGEHDGKEEHQATDRAIVRDDG